MIYSFRIVEEISYHRVNKIKHHKLRLVRNYLKPIFDQNVHPIENFISYNTLVNTSNCSQITPIPSEMKKEDLIISPYLVVNEIAFLKHFF